MALMFECDCEDRFVARGGDEDELVEQVERHVAQAHPALIGKLSRADILARATVV
jgi:hypothetical protein